MTLKLFRRLALLASLLALCVVVLGAYVRLSDAGLGCPDWPGCYGALSVPQSEAALQQAQQAYPDKPVHAHKAWKEMAHRYAAGTLGLLVLALFVLGWRLRTQLRVSPWVPTALLVLIVFQAMLGMWTVTLLLKPVVVTAHLLGGMSTLALLTWITHRHWRQHAMALLATHGVRLGIRIGLLVLLGQIVLGGWTSSNYAALACTDFPTCHGVWWPHMDMASGFHLIRELGQGVDGSPLTLAAYTAIQWVHRLGALVTLVYWGIIACYLLGRPSMRSNAVVLLLLLASQVGLGIANLLLHLPLALAVAHNLGAALLLITVVVINSKITNSNIKNSKITGKTIDVR